MVSHTCEWSGISWESVDGVVILFLVEMRLKAKTYMIWFENFLGEPSPKVS